MERVDKPRPLTSVVTVVSKVVSKVLKERQGEAEGYGERRFVRLDGQLCGQEAVENSGYTLIK